MKARFLPSVLVSLFLFSFTFAQDKLHCPTADCDFQPGEQVYAFGHKIKLRAEPDIRSQVLDELVIGEWVKIVEKTPFSWPYNGFDSPFYKVTYNGMTGYLLGGLLSLDKKTVNDRPYFFAYAKQGSDTFLKVRTILHGSYLEKQIPIKNPRFAIATMDNRGIPNLDGILYIDYKAGPDSVEDGGVYLFLNHFNLGDAVELSERKQAGSYYHSEQFIFPDDEGGLADKVLYKKVWGRNLDIDTQWQQSARETRILSWTDGQLRPNPHEKGQ